MFLLNGSVINVTVITFHMLWPFIRGLPLSCPFLSPRLWEMGSDPLLGGSSITFPAAGEEIKVQPTSAAKDKFLFKK